MATRRGNEHAGGPAPAATQAWRRQAAIDVPLSLRQGRLKRGSKWWPMGGVAARLARRNSNLFDLFKLISNGIDLIRSKDGLLELKSFEIKYEIQEN
jgi:hypothetical protein